MTGDDLPNQTDASASEPLPEIGGYRLLRMIGQGGMSTVYLARQLALDREVALKVMLPEALTDEVSRRRFENEARTIARLEHPHIVSIYEVGRSRTGLPYFAMPHLPRGHLGQRDYTGDHARVYDVLDALLSALEYAHARGVVHRDVKAENVLFDEAERPLLADFGIALRRGFGPRVTTAGLAVGSTAYMPPEQARGEQVDGRADLYSIGVLAWEMLTGSLPYNAADALSMALQHAQDPIPRLPPELRHWQKFLDKAIAKHPGARYQNAAEMRKALREMRTRHGTAAKPRKASAAPAAGSRRRYAAAALVVAVVVAIGASVLWPRSAPPSAPAIVQSPASAAAPTAQTGPDNAPTTATAAPEQITPPMALPAPAAGAAGRPLLPARSVVDAMMRPLPESPAERPLGDAERQLNEGKLTVPKGDNAYDSVLAAWRADPSYARLPLVVAAVIEVLGSEAERSMRAGKANDAELFVKRALTLADTTGNADGAAAARLRERVGKMVAARIADAGKRGDRAAARRALALGQIAKVDPQELSRLSEQVDAIEDQVMTASTRGGATEGTAGTGPGVVSRGQYAQFARATGRPAALCRERGSPLRVLAPRSWESPGFAQSSAHPVVCVSWNDANAYAQWASQRSGRKYRLPGNAAGTASAGKPIAVWLDACADGCRSRLASGRTWRGVTGKRPLDPNRGYDDVGFRLVQGR